MQCRFANKSTNWTLSTFIQHDHWISTIAAILTNKYEHFICHDTVTTIRILPFDLISQIYVFIVQKPYCCSIGKRIIKIHIFPAKQIQIIHNQSIYTQCIDLFNQLLFKC